VLPFATRADLLTWLDAGGIAHVARLNLEALAPYVAAEHRASLTTLGAKKRLIELASTEHLERARQWLAPSPASHAFREAMPLFMEAELAKAAQARAAVPARLQAPQPGNPVFETLLTLRARFADSVAPRAELSLEALRVDPSLPGFVFRDDLLSESRPTGAFLRPEVRIALAPAEVTCSCGLGLCVHALAAIDTALAWCVQPRTPELDAQLKELSRQPWERTLERLERALQRDAKATTARVTWGVRVTQGEGVEVVALLQKGKRWVETSPRELFRAPGAHLSGVDEKLVSLMPGEGEPRGFASKLFLEALIEHPRVVLLDAPERAVRVERAIVGLVAEERLGSVHVRAGVDGASLPDVLREQARLAPPTQALFFWDEGPRRLTLLEVKPELRAALAVLKSDRDIFPPESHSALLGALSKWAQHLPVSMPRSVMGESVSASTALVMRLQVETGGTVALEIRVRPLPDGPALVPGQGPRDLHLRRGERAVHAVRALGDETLAARALCDELPLADVEPLHDPFQYRLASAHHALDALALVAHRAPPVELEWVGEPLRTLGSRGPGALRVKLEKRREWFGVLGELHVGGERVELARVLDTVRRKERYLRLSTHSYLELSQALRAHLEALVDHVHPTKHGLEVGPSALESLGALELAGAEFTADSDWRALETRIAAAKQTVVTTPPGLNASLRSYQLDGFRWLATLAEWGAGAVLADDMGLGKTVQSLALLLHRRELGPALVVAPTSVAFNWQEEAARFAPSLKLTVYADEANRVNGLRALGPGDVLVVSYGLLVRDLVRLASVHFATAVFDEAQALKNAKTQRARAARQLVADFKCALSGTPFENHLGELWSLFSIVFPPLLGSWEAFRSRYAVVIEKQLDPAAAPALSRVLSPFLLRRTKAQVETELPPRTEVRVPVVLSAPEWQLYEDTRLAALSDLETSRAKMKEQERRIQVLAALTRLRLIAAHPRLHDPRSKLASSKLARLLELALELRAEGHRALIFSQFTTHLALVREALDAQGIASVYLDGQTPRRARSERVHEFQMGDAPFFLISLKAGGVGLNLTAATTVIHLDPWWNPAVEDQASDRAHRLGQTKPVTVFRMVAMGTIEEQMLTLHAAKKSLITRVLEGTDQAASLSTRELISLLK